MKKSFERSGHNDSAKARKKNEYEGRRSILFERNTSFCFLARVLPDYYMGWRIFIICKSVLIEKQRGEKNAYS